MILPSIHVGIQTLRANPVRTLLSTLGVVIGAAALVGVLSIGDGTEAFARQQIEQRGGQAVAVMPKIADAIDGLSIPRSGFPIFGIDDARTLSGRIMPGAALAMTTEGIGTFVTTSAGPARAARITGIYGSTDALPGAVPVIHGRFLSEAEMAGDAAVAVVSNKLGRELSAGRPLGDVVGTPLLLQGQSWSIVGILEESPDIPGFGPLPSPFGVTIPLGRAAAGMLPSTSARPRTILVRAPRVEDVAAVRAQVEAWADATNPRWRAEPQVAINSTGLERLKQLGQVMLVLKMVMGAFTAISLVVGGIGIMNVLLASVVERTREIGLRKAAGAKHRDIVVQFLSESVTISVAGAMLGAVVGLASSMGITALIRWRSSAPFHAAFTWQTLLVSMSAAIAVGLIFGVYPALKAARLSPVDAMRYE
jgi:putative ABC transport system permease protein